jgi:hypothetical protein
MENPQGQWGGSSDRVSELPDIRPVRQGGRRLTPIRVAGAALSPLEDLKALEAVLRAFVQRWQWDPENVESTVDNAKQLLQRIPEALQRCAAADPYVRAAYEQIRVDLANVYAPTIDAILVFQPVLAAYAEMEQTGVATPRQIRVARRNLIEAQREVILAIGQFQDYFSRLVSQLELLSKKRPS